MSLFKSSTTVQLAVDRTEFHPGDPVTARVVVAGEPDDRVQGGRVELAYVNRYLDEERYRDSDGDMTTRTVTREETVVAASHPLPGSPTGPVAPGDHTVTLTFPHQSPPSAHEPEGFGDLIRWEVRAILDRKMAFDPDAKQVVTVFSRPEDYLAWAQSPPVSKSADCPMGLELSTRALRPGEGLTGELTITPRESAKGRSIRVQLERRRTDTPDNLTRTETIEGPQLAGETDLEAGQTLRFPFEIALPAGVPPNFTTGKSNLHWFVEGVVDRRLKSDFVVEAEIVVYTGTPGPAVATAPAATAAPADAPAGTPAPAPAGPVPDATAAPGSHPAAWYPDPWLNARLRYWDGNAWTGHTAE
jgi:sporulation-control protein spo0M